jgi:hypothetical protein
MKHLLLTTIAAVVLVGCGESQESVPSPEAKPVEPIAEAAKPEPPTAKAPDTDIHTAAMTRNIEAVKQHLAAGTDVNPTIHPGNAKWELYDLSKDIYEENDLATASPDQLAELIKIWEKLNGEMSEPLF